MAIRRCRREAIVRAQSESGSQQLSSRSYKRGLNDIVLATAAYGMHRHWLLLICQGGALFGDSGYVNSLPQCLRHAANLSLELACHVSSLLLPKRQMKQKGYLYPGTSFPASSAKYRPQHPTLAAHIAHYTDPDCLFRHIVSITRPYPRIHQLRQGSTAVRRGSGAFSPSSVTSHSHARAKSECEGKQLPRTPGRSASVLPSGL